MEETLRALDGAGNVAESAGEDQVLPDWVQVLGLFVLRTSEGDALPDSDSKEGGGS